MVFVCPVNDFKSLTVCEKHSILDAWRDSEYACVHIASNNVLCHHNKRLFLYGSGIIFLPLNIPEKLHWQNLFKKPEEAETHRLYLSEYYTHALWRTTSTIRLPPPFFHSDTNAVFGHVLIHSFDKTHVLFVTVELIWLLLLNILSFKFAPEPNKFLLCLQDSEEAM